MIFYRYFAYPFLVFILKVLALSNSKIKKGFEIRKNKPWLNFKDIPSPILIHCSSGEFEYAKSVIREIKSKNPLQKIVVTYFSPTYESQIKGFPGVDFSCPIPWDCISIQKSFLKKLAPTKILIARTDLWPEFLTQANQLHIPVYLFSATLSESSFKLSNPISKLFTRWIYKKLTHIFCVSEDDRKNFSKILPAEKMTAIGDTRYDQVLFRIQNPRPLKTSLKPINFLFCAGSTWPEDEEQLLPIFNKLTEKSIQVMIAPHEPTPAHLADLVNKIKNLKLRPVLYSQVNSWNPDEVLIIDEVGILADLYAWSTWVFVGGSFKKTVHSVMEPLAQGCQTFFGPHHHNNREALEFKNYADIAYEVQSGVEVLTQVLKNLLPEKNIKLKKMIQETIQAKSGASKALCNAVYGSRTLCH